MSRIEQYFDIDRMMFENELLLAYRDHISEDTIQQLLSITELKLVQSGEDKKLRKRVFSILVECLQNIVNHAENGKGKDEVPSILLMGRHDGDFFIITGNRIANSNIKPFISKVDEINSWEHHEMRKIYSEKLGSSKYSSKGGAGLGLIDIYKRSGSKLEYQIDPIDEDLSFLSFRIKIDTDPA